MRTSRHSVGRTGGVDRWRTRLVIAGLAVALPLVVTARPGSRATSPEAAAARAELRSAMGQVSGGLGRMRRALSADGCPPEARAMFEEGTDMAASGLNRLLDLSLTESADPGVSAASWDAQIASTTLTEDVSGLRARWAARCGTPAPDDVTVTFEPLGPKTMQASASSGDGRPVAGGTFVISVPGPSPADFVAEGPGVAPWDPSAPLIYAGGQANQFTIDMTTAPSLLPPGPFDQRPAPQVRIAAGANEVRRDVVFDPRVAGEPTRDDSMDQGLTVRTPAGVRIQEITKDQEFIVRLVVPRQDGATPPRDVTVTLATPTGTVDVPLTTTQSAGASSLVRYDSQVLTWNADRGFLTFLEEALTDEFIGLYRQLSVENGDLLTVSYGSLIYPVTVYDTWVQRGIGNVERVLFDTAERVLAEMDAVEDGLRAGAIDETTAAQVERSGRQWLDFVARTRRVLDGLDNDYERFFVGTNLIGLLTSDPSTWNDVVGNPGEMAYETFGEPGTSRRESEAIRRGVYLAEQAYDQSWRQAISDTLLRGYAVFAGVSGAEDLWVLLHAGAAALLQFGVAAGVPGSAEVTLPVTNTMGEEVGGDQVLDAAKNLALGVFLVRHFSTAMREGGTAVAESRAARDATLRSTNDLDVGTYQGPTKVIVGKDVLGADVTITFPDGRPPTAWSGRSRGIRDPILPSGEPLGVVAALNPRALEGVELEFPGLRPGDPPITVDVSTRLGGGSYGEVYEVRNWDAHFGEPVVAKIYLRREVQGPSDVQGSELPTVLPGERAFSDPSTAVWGEQVGEFYLARTQNGPRPVAYKKTLTAVLDGPSARVIRQRLRGDPELQARIARGDVPLDQVPDAVEFQWPSNRPMPRQLQEATINLYDDLHLNGLLAEDVAPRNLYYFREDGQWKAGILDPDLVTVAHAADGRVVARREAMAMLAGRDDIGVISLRQFEAFESLDDITIRELLFRDPKLFKYYTAERHKLVTFEVMYRSQAEANPDVVIIAPSRTDPDRVLVLTNKGVLDRDLILDRWPDIGQHLPDTPAVDPTRAPTNAVTDPAFTNPAPSGSFFLPGAERWLINLRGGLAGDFANDYSMMCGEGFRVPDLTGGDDVQTTCTPLPDAPADLPDQLRNDPRVTSAEPDRADSMAVSAPPWTPTTWRATVDTPRHARRLPFLAGFIGASGRPIQPDDQYFNSRGTWGQPYDDQWALKRIGLDGASDVWPPPVAQLTPVVVAVIDSGLDFAHPDLDPANVWRNHDETPNGIDDDHNGYVDDLIGWNFVDFDNNPWDYTGHGTHTAGIMAGAIGNGEGIAGINPAVQIMPLKVLNVVGQGRRSRIARAIYYAVDNGARVINMSLGAPALSPAVQRAVDYAHASGVLVIVAAGNALSDTIDYNPVGLSHVLSVAATDPDDRRAAFSNWGQSIDLAAPGVEVLSLRARRTDFFQVSGAESYAPGGAFVGPQSRYMRGTGTSFAAPLVAGVASLIWANRPDLSAEQVERMLVMSGDDIDVPGWDQYSGAGRLNAVNAIAADPDFYLHARIRAVEPRAVEGRTVVRVLGTVVGTALERYSVEVGQGEAPTSWTEVATVTDRAVEDDVIFDIPIGAITARGRWTIRIIATDESGRSREARGALNVQ